MQLTTTDEPMRGCRAVRAHARGARAAVLGVLVGSGLLGGRAQAQEVTPAQSLLAARLATAPREPARPLAAFSSSAQRLRDSLVVLARAQVGRRYRTGGQSPDQGFDCSGLVRYVMAALQVDVPRTARQQAVRGLPVATDTAQLKPGDLLTFGSRKRVSHIGIYVGDGRFVHASSVAGRVIESPVARRRAPLIKPWAGVRRVLADADSSASTTGAAR
jgi:cell wall-associated NlpC family hydrolase